MHRQGIVRFGALVLRTGADEVDAIVHLACMTDHTERQRHPFRGTGYLLARYGTDTPPLGGLLESHSQRGDIAMKHFGRDYACGAGRAASSPSTVPPGLSSVT